MRTLLARFLGMFGSSSRLDEEIESHIAMQAAEFERSGMSPAEAHERAARAFGHATQIREQHREQSRLPGLDSFVQDIRYALRQWRANRVFAFTAIATLALSIGATTSIYQLLDAIVIRPLPVRAPEELVLLETTGFSYPQFVEMSKRSTTAELFATGFGRIKEFRAEGQTLSDAQLLYASGNFFTGLGTTPQVGRLFTTRDDAPDSLPIVVISDAFWEQQFQRRADILGRAIQMNGIEVRIVGVTQPEFYGDRLGTPVDAWIPMGKVHTFAPSQATPGSSWLQPMARLRPGVSTQRAQAELNALWLAIEDLGIRMNGPRKLEIRPGSHGLVTMTDFQRPLWLLMGIVGVLLLIGCSNLANLLMARATARTHEIGVRLAIGAGRARVIRQLLTESMLLALIGGAVGLGLAAAGARLILNLAMAGQRWYLPTTIDWRIAGFTTLVSVGAVIVFGMVPAFAATGIPVALRSESRTHSASRFRQFATRGFVVAQIALSMLLVAGAALLLRSFWNLAHQDFGYDVESVLSASLTNRGDFSRDIFEPESQLRIAERVRQIPGVIAGGVSVSGLLDEGLGLGGMPIATESRLVPESAKIRMIAVSPGYMETMAIPLKLGRALAVTDRKNAPRVAVVSESAARAIFGKQNPIGQRIFSGKTFRADRSYEIVGVMRDIRYATPREDPGPLIFAPTGQFPGFSNPTVVVRVAGDPARFARALEDAAGEAAPTLKVFRMRTLREAINSHARRERLLAWLSGGFGALALILAAVGLYGVVAYAAEQRTTEMGIRLALGATQSHVRGLLLREVLWMLAAGLSIGAIAILGLGRLLDSLLFGLSSHDPLTLALALLVLSGITILAGYLPARRVASIDPSSTLRRES